MSNKFGLNFVRNVARQPLLFDCVPKHAPVSDCDVESLRNFIDQARKIVVVTGAGISTESGIPDYRSEEVGLYARSNHRPIKFQEFLKSAATRQRYWARNYAGWPRFSQRAPNITHFVVRDLETVDKISSVVTQNVDGLHFKAGSRKVIELHGTAFRVVCLSCRAQYDRDEVQRELAEMNPHMRDTSQMVRPDGDVEISQEEAEAFTAPICGQCGGTLKPDITFFGDNVPKSRVDAVRDSVSNSDSVLVLGSSLFVFSGYRIILQAVEEKKNVAIVNIGSTRADKHADLKISARCGDILPRVC